MSSAQTSITRVATDAEAVAANTNGTAAAAAAANAPTTQQKAGSAATLRQKRLLGFGLLLLGFLMAYLLLVFWPEEFAKNANGISVDANGNPVTGSTRQMVYLIGDSAALAFKMRLDVRLLLVVMMAGGLGSFVHVATSFSDYVGNEKLTSNWLWFYVLRPFIGMMLAVVFYLVIRGGFLGINNTADSINPFGIAALAGLVGMFSKQATDKLSEVFDTLFKSSSGDAKRKDDLQNPIPVLTDVEPKNIEPKTDNLVVTVTGTGFVRGASVRVNGAARETQFVDGTHLGATLLPEDVANEGELVVTVFNPGPGGGTSTPIKLKIAPSTSLPSTNGTSGNGSGKLLLNEPKNTTREETDETPDESTIATETVDNTTDSDEHDEEVENEGGGLTTDKSSEEDPTRK